MTSPVNPLPDLIIGSLLLVAVSWGIYRHFVPHPRNFEQMTVGACVLRATLTKRTVGVTVHGALVIRKRRFNKPVVYLQDSTGSVALRTRTFRQALRLFDVASQSGNSRFVDLEGWYIPLERAVRVYRARPRGQ